MSKKTKHKYIELHYYEHNKVFPDQSGSVDKKIFERKSHIARLTPYINSTKIHTTYGAEYEVCESVEEIWKLLDI
jgi:hypothetical protein